MYVISNANPFVCLLCICIITLFEANHSIASFSQSSHQRDAPYSNNINTVNDTDLFNVSESFACSQYENKLIMNPYLNCS